MPEEVDRLIGMRHRNLNKTLVRYIFAIWKLTNEVDRMD